MQQKKLILNIVVLICIGLKLQAQEAIQSSGGNALGSGGVVSYTIGQVFYSTSFGANGSVAEGVQQTFEIELIEGIEQANGIKLICNVYPNPTIGQLTLSIENYNSENLSYQLFDAGGKLIENKNIESNEIIISMSNLTPAMYFLIVTEGQKEIKSFQIIKN